MAEIVNVTISRPLSSVNSGEKSPGSILVDNSAVLKKKFDQHISKIDSLCNMLTSAIEQTNSIKQQTISQSKDDIASLAVEIAEMILVDKISHGEYDIEKIIASAIDDVPDKDDIQIDVSENDKSLCDEMIKKNPDSCLRGLKINVDPSMSPAQCRVRTRNGKIDCFYKEQLEKIGKALKGGC